MTDEQLEEFVSKLVEQVEEVSGPAQMGIETAIEFYKDVIDGFSDELRTRIQACEEDLAVAQRGYDEDEED